MSLQRAAMVLSAAVLACAAATAEEPDSLRVMSFNIRYGTADDGENAWEHRRELVAETIGQFDPVLVGLQECLEFQAEYLVEALPAYRWFGVGRDADGSGERMAILYRTDVVNPVETGNFWLCETPDVPGTRSWNSACNRMVTWGKFYRHADQRMFHFFNTHFDHESEDARRGAAGVLRKYATKIAGKGAPVIVTGDFNAVAEQSVPWKRLDAAGFVDAWCAADERVGPVVTWSGFEPPRPDSDRRIDWVLVRGPLSVLHCETVTYHQNGRYPSDHFPVFAEIAFTP